MGAWGIKAFENDGALAKARARFESGSACPAVRRFDEMSCWALIGEEIIDTEYESEDYDAIYAELIQRGFSPESIAEMCAFGWRTLGWLNYKKMVLDWVSLDENDILRALDWQLEEGKIDAAKRSEELAFMNSHLEREKNSR